MNDEWTMTKEKRLHASITAKTLNVLFLTAQVSYIYITIFIENIWNSIHNMNIQLLYVTKMYGKSLWKYFTSVNVWKVPICFNMWFKFINKNILQSEQYAY
jgi:hypothetical protein